MNSGSTDDQDRGKRPTPPPLPDDSPFMPPAKLTPPYKPPAAHGDKDTTQDDSSPPNRLPAGVHPPELHAPSRSRPAETSESVYGCLVALLVAAGLGLLLFGTCLLSIH